MKDQPRRPYLLAEANLADVGPTDYEVAVLPWGATEAHNFHLPYATDNYQLEGIISTAAKKAWEAGAKIIVLPTIPYGVQTGQLDIKLCMNILPATQLALLKDLCEVLIRAGICKLAILNGHGGNDFKAIIRELSFHFPDLFVCCINWFGCEPKEGYFEHPDGDHADEMETSLMLHLRPHLVDMAKAGDGRAKKWKFKAMCEGWVVGQRQWTKVSADTGVGNPHQATAEKGEKYLAAVSRKIAGFLIELAATPNGEFYE
ncbi:MAG TPA: creatininase family protein [Bacteroidetes bacterium]|nr:creatininase family protein [Bacteroidota bacterium]